ncbi:MAG: outer membrane beta-barrel protein [Halofilum sp. (in: g-proteobacteria)]
MSRVRTTVPVIVAMLFPLPAAATQFSGLSVGLGASSFSVDMESEFDAPGMGPSSATADKTGGMVDVGYGFMPSRSIHLQAGVRSYPIELEANLYDDDCVKIDQHVAAYGQVGYLFNDRNMLYGIFEAGGAEVTVHTEGYADREFEPDTFAFGVGYKYAMASYVEFFVEGMNRSYDMMDIHYGREPADSEEYAGAKKDIDLTSTNLTAGFQFRF